MRTAIGIGGPAYGGERRWDDVVSFVVEAERLGVDFAWSAEAWGMDAVSSLAFVAARTSRITLGTGIMQISARVPAMTAMTALSLATISEGRFVLGLGTSGPQVVEGLHGVAFGGGATRLRENVEIIRRAAAGERLQYEGRHFRLPLPGGEGKALRLSHEYRPDLPIYLATLAPRGLRLTGELADGWLGASFTPEHADAHLDHIAAGASATGRSLADLDLQAGGSVAFGENLDRLIAPRKKGLAFMLGAMGSARTNFYNQSFKRGGYQDSAVEVQRLWLAGRHDEAATRVPDEMVLQTNFLGDDDMVRERMRSYRDAGITALRLAPDGKTLDEKLTTLARALDIVRNL
jgi:F420-dependent oxidoreductase-like protein